MSEELTIESIEMWNEEHEDDCHSPCMGILEGETSEMAEQVEVPKSPCTGDITGLIVAAMVVSVVVIVATLRGVLGKGMGGKK